MDGHFSHIILTKEKDMTFTTTDFIAISSMLVALSSFVISYLVYKKDKGELSVSISQSDICDANTFKVEQSGVYIKVISIGHRPVIFSSIGGDYSGWFKKFISYLFPCCFQTSAYLLSGQNLNPLLYEDLTNNKFRVMAEGETFYHFFSFPTFEELAKMIIKAKNFYIMDSMEKKHVVPRRIFNKFKRDINKHMSSK